MNKHKMKNKLKYNTYNHWDSADKYNNGDNTPCRLGDAKSSNTNNTDKNIWLILSFAIQIKNNLVKSIFSIINSHFNNNIKYKELISIITIEVESALIHNLAAIISTRQEEFGLILYEKKESY